MAAYDILTAAEVKAYLGVSGSGNDTIIGTFISDVSLWIEDYLGRKVKASQAVTDEIGNGDGTEKHIPKYPPVTAVTTLKKRGSPTSDWQDIVTDTDNILIDPVNGDYVEVYGTCFPHGRSNVKITYTAGYAVTPAPIKQVAYEMVAVRLRESNISSLGLNRLGVESMSSTDAGGGSNSRTFADLEPRWKSMLRPYIKPYKQVGLVR